MNIFFLLTNNINGDIMNNKQTIKCDVYNCKYCDCNRDICKLKRIKISNCKSDNPYDATICASFKEIK